MYVTSLYNSNVFPYCYGQTILQMTTYILGGLRSINGASPQELVKFVCQKESLPLPLAKGTYGSPWTWAHIKAHAGLQAPQSLFTSILPAPTAVPPPDTTVSSLSLVSPTSGAMGFLLLPLDSSDAF